MQNAKLYVVISLILGGILGFLAAREWDRPRWREEIPRPIKVDQYYGTAGVAEEPTEECLDPAELEALCAALELDS